MLLSESTIKENIENGKLFSNSISSEIQPSSVDLTIESFYLPNKKHFFCFKSKDDIDNYKYKQISLKSGQTAIIQVAESFEMPNNIGGIVFPPNKLSRMGLLMTNPGHIDPGFKGKITVCLINMGRETIKLKKGEIISTLLLFQVDAETPGLKQNKPSPGVVLDQLESLTDDFANISGRMNKQIQKKIGSNLLIALGFFSLFITIVLTVVPSMVSYFNSPNLNQVKEWNITKEYVNPLNMAVEKLKKTTEELESKLEKQKTKFDSDISKKTNEIDELKKEIGKLAQQISITKPKP